MIRETVYSRVFAFWSGLTIGTSPAFKTATRKLQTWDQAAPEDQPMLLMQQRRESARYRKGLPTLWTLEVALFLYVHSGAQNDPAVIPSQLLNPLLDAIQAALTVDDPSNDACTLGGIVSHCAINGAVEIFQGDQGDQEVAIIPLEIVVTP